MGGEPSMQLDAGSHRRVPGPAAAANGKELFRSPGAQLFLIVGDESELMQSGEFVLVLVKHRSSFLAAVLALVGDMQWPIGKDCVVTKAGEGRFSFALPGELKYGLTLDDHPSASLKELEQILGDYAAYTIKDSTELSGSDAERQASMYWSRLAKESETQPVSSRPAAPGKLSQSMARRMQQARRMSAVAKLFSKSIEKGAINASTHVKLAANLQPDSMGLVVASADAVAKVLDAVETAGKTLFESAQAAGTSWVRRNYGYEHAESAAEGLQAMSSLLNSAWTLNKVGLFMLFRTIASIHGGGSSSVCAPPSLSCGTSQMRQSPSSGSSSSCSSKSSIFSSPMSVDDNAPYAGILKIASVQPSRVETAQHGRLARPPRSFDASMPPPSTPPSPPRQPLFLSGSPSFAKGVESDALPSFRLYKPQPRPVAPTPLLSHPPPVPSQEQAANPHESD